MGTFECVSQPFFPLGYQPVWLALRHGAFTH